LVRAPVSKTGGWGFESLLSCQLNQRVMKSQHVGAFAPGNPTGNKRLAFIPLLERWTSARRPYDRDTANVRRLRAASVVASFRPNRMPVAPSGHVVPWR
jgi:hypothetical protein